MNDVASSQGIWHGTTILTVRKGGRVVIAGDGQVSLGATVIKANARKVRSVGKGDVIGGFAGATADAFTLFERLESKLEQYPAQLTRACVELAKDWRTDRYLRRLEAMMIVADRETTLVLTGTGDVLEPERGLMGIGSGGNYALAAARALIDTPHRRRGDRPQGDGDRRRDLRLHQHQRRPRGARQQQMTASRSPLPMPRTCHRIRPMQPRDLPMVRAGWRRRTSVNGGETRTSNSPWSAGISQQRALEQFIVISGERPFAYLQCYEQEAGRRTGWARIRRALGASISSSASRTCSAAATVRHSSARSSMACWRRARRASSPIPTLPTCAQSGPTRRPASAGSGSWTRRMAARF